MSNKGFDRFGITGAVVLTACLFAHPFDWCQAGDLTDAGDLSIPVVTSTAKVSPPTPASAVPSASPFFDTVSKLLREYYPPRALKIHTKSNTYHAEYKVRMYDVAQTNTVEPGPEWSGIWLTMELKPGPYKGVEAVPKLLNQYDGPYKVMILAPDAKKLDCHMSVRIAYPLDVNPDFLTQFKTTVADFEKFLVP
jgi:hypothetical protein